MKRKITAIITIILLMSVTTVLAQSGTHTVVSGDSMWKIAVRYEIGLSELIEANPQISNPALIYPGQKITIPNIDSVKQLEQQVVDLVNAQRSKNGLPALTHNWELSRVARYKSQDMIDKNYGSPFDMMKSFGISYTAAGENIAKGQNSPQSVMNAWMNSSGHRANILNKSYNQIGVGVAKDSRGNLYWTQMFIKK